MKKVILFTLLAVLFACEKEDQTSTDELKSLVGTEWTGTMPDYFDGAVLVKVTSQTQATFTVSSVTVTFSYTYNSSLQTGTLTSEGDTFTFEISGNTLILTDPYSDTYNFTRTK